MKLFWKLFCSMVSVTILVYSIGGYLLIDGQFRTSLENEVETLYAENDMLRYALSREAEGQIMTGREVLSQLAAGVTLTTGGRTVAFRLSDTSGANLGGSGYLLVEAYPLISSLSENQRGWKLDRNSEHTIVLHGASALTLGQRVGRIICVSNIRHNRAIA